jgi:hypothetical protein
MDGDGFYGMSLNLLQSLDKQGLELMAVVHKDRYIYFLDPEPYIPDNLSKKVEKRATISE